MPDDFKFMNIDECKNQKEAEEYYKERGWDILKPKITQDRSKCKHIWKKIAENDYQCIKCLQGYIGVPNGTIRK